MKIDELILLLNFYQGNAARRRELSITYTSMTTKLVDKGYLDLSGESPQVTPKAYVYINAVMAIPEPIEITTWGYPEQQENE